MQYVNFRLEILQIYRVTVLLNFSKLLAVAYVLLLLLLCLFNDNSSISTIFVVKKKQRNETLEVLTHAFQIICVCELQFFCIT